MTMVKSIIVLLIFICSYLTGYAKGDTKIIVGKVPGEYLGKDQKNHFLAKIEISEAGFIESINPIDSSDISPEMKKLKKNGRWLGIYPGLIDLHGHPKQNVLPLWEKANGQFANRHEWRDWSQYTKDVSGNMNPWSGDEYMLSHCAAFRWAELQAMVLGTTYQQGWSFCDQNFSIMNVENGDGVLESETNAAGDFILPNLKVSAPTDLIFPKEFTFPWEMLKPIKEKHNASFDKAVEIYLQENCLSFYNQILSVYESETLELRSKLLELNVGVYKDYLKAEKIKHQLKLPRLYSTSVISYIKENIKSCEVEGKHKKFDRFMSRILPVIAGKYSHLTSKQKGVVLAHLAEGRINDPYNKIEFELLKLVDLNLPGMNLVHALGLSEENFKELGEKGMGIVWSPFSNLLLYNETLDIKLLKSNNVLIALGSDWTPTGSKSVLEEVKIAKQYLIKRGIFDSLGGDQYLYNMMTKNPAKMIGRYESKIGDGRYGIGTLKPEAMASLIALDIKKQNPYSNLVDSSAKNVQYVMAAGKEIYGAKEILSEKENLEKLPNYLFKDVTVKTFSSQIESNKDFINVYNSELVKNLKGQNICSFEDKFFVLDKEQSKTVKAINDDFGINLNSPMEIQRVLGVMLLTQTTNVKDDHHHHSVDYFPPLFSCNDEKLSERLKKFVSQEIDENYVLRLEFRQAQQTARDTYNSNDPVNPRISVPNKLANSYSLDYEVDLGIFGY